jgi:hypothetical protein
MNSELHHKRHREERKSRSGADKQALHDALLFFSTSPLLHYPSPCSVVNTSALLV